jgi:hypothetical protein
LYEVQTTSEEVMISTTKPTKHKATESASVQPAKKTKTAVEKTTSKPAKKVKK